MAEKLSPVFFVPDVEKEIEEAREAKVHKKSTATTKFFKVLLPLLLLLVALAAFLCAALVALRIGYSYYSNTNDDGWPSHIFNPMTGVGNDTAAAYSLKSGALSRVFDDPNTNSKPANNFTTDGSSDTNDDSNDDDDDERDAEIWDALGSGRFEEYARHIEDKLNLIQHIKNLEPFMDEDNSTAHTSTEKAKVEKHVTATFDPPKMYEVPKATPKNPKNYDYPYDEVLKATPANQIDVDWKPDIEENSVDFGDTGYATPAKSQPEKFDDKWLLHSKETKTPSSVLIDKIKPEGPKIADIPAEKNVSESTKKSTPELGGAIPAFTHANPMVHPTLPDYRLQTTTTPQPSGHQSGFVNFFDNIFKGMRQATEDFLNLFRVNSLFGTKPAAESTAATEVPQLQPTSAVIRVRFWTTNVTSLDDEDPGFLEDV